MDGTMEIMQRAFQIEQKDNVATALEELIPGALRLLGDGCMREAEAVQKIPKGHKIALQNIRAGEDVIKYGVRIARASGPGNGSIFTISAACTMSAPATWT